MVNIKDIMKSIKKLDMIDLTYPIEPEMLVNTGLKRPVFEWVSRINSEGLNITHFNMLVHTGTHIDSPFHAIKNGSTIDEIPLNKIVGISRLFRLKKFKYKSEITIDDVINSGYKIEKDSIFIFHTGIEKYSNKKEYNYNYSVPSIELIEWLIENKISSFMTDITNIDFPNENNFIRHKLLLKENIPIIENLKNLSLLPFNEDIIICALPLLLNKREGAPCRIIALKNKYYTAKKEYKND